MNYLLMSLDNQRKPSCNPIVVLFANGNVDHFLFVAALTVGLESQKFED
jgi:hypothetical protein